MSLRQRLAVKVKRVIALSTDKAANPINLYGATKLVSDKLFVAGKNIVGEDETRFSAVRYGNVVGSRGSIVPFFQKIIKNDATTLPITHPYMTRFWITLQDGVDFVLKNFERMQGGEIFVPKIPSVRITDLAEAYSPGLKHDIVGIRPGEKMHEIMCPADDSHHTIKFDEYFVITPSISFFGREHDYSISQLGEQGALVKPDFEYHSGNNHHFLSTAEIMHLDEESV
jgi:UDP-N-acetylglucosamine 4,6-dehydratase